MTDGTTAPHDETAAPPQRAIELALAAASCDECVVIADEASTANLRWAGNSLTTNGVARTRLLTVIAMQHVRDGSGPAGVRVGAVSRSGVREDQIAGLVAAAEQAARQGPAADDAQPLPSADGAAGLAGGAAWDAEPIGTDITVLGGVARGLREAFDAAAAGGRKLYGFAEHTMISSFLGTSTGLRLRHDQPTGTVELNAKTADPGNSAWTGAATRDFADTDIAAMAAGLTRRLDWAARRVELPAGRYETLLPANAVADLMICLYWAAGARDTLDGRTVFSKPGGGTRVGERLTDLPVTLRSDPREPGLECHPFVLAHASSRASSAFDNGLALRGTDWISGGRLAALAQTRHSARLSGLPVTPLIGNLILEAPADAGSLADLVAGTRRGLLLTCLHYVNEVDPQTLLTTGLTRDGVYLVENGEVTAAVNNFRFNDSPVGMLSRITGAGPSQPTLSREWQEYFTRTAMPPLRVADFNMSSVSQAT